VCSRTGSGLRLALVALAIANSWRLIQALPGDQSDTAPLHPYTGTLPR
jgi:hypothetical protein